jgi:nucleotide-binding universal stress UspA family protein
MKVKAEDQGPSVSRYFDDIRDVMVHLDGTSEDEVRIAHGEAIAAVFDAHLTGIYTNLLPDLRLIGTPEAGGASIAAFVAVEDESRRHSAETFRCLTERFSRLSVSNELRPIDAAPGSMADLVAAEARWSDVFVATCPYRDNGSLQWDEVLETVLFEGGHSVYFIPPGLKPRPKWNRALVAWTDTREAARGVAEGIPFLRRASDVEIIIVGAGDQEKKLRAYEAVDIAAHLDRHWIKVSVRPVDRDSRSVSDMLLEEIDGHSADLIVMGAYGHSRWREWIIGGTTRDTLVSCKVPVLMAH